ncbi:hypothetical protein [Fonticella tunisiensis]|uniref:Uncharacterized protein n=1 Tax=Fonticella tunisiensis TaxID=1096341 RepID=A0A4R7KP91_9CLOT|nr:hypothetical protein [Fonticella tunisiensis]TDT58386.1 hypothetical protein EDD71_11120 [Fonticella tunisiensis]
MKKLLAALMALLVIIPAGFAYAETTPQETRAQLSEYRQKLKEKLSVIKEQKEQNKTLREQAKEKTAQMKEKVKALRKDKKAIPMETLDKMEAQLQVIKDDMIKVKGWGSYFIEYERIRTNKINKNYDGALAGLDKIIQMQKDRNAALTKLNSDLDTLMGMIP